MAHVILINPKFDPSFWGRLGRNQLRDGYIEVMQRLYDPTAYFERVRRLYVDGPLASLVHWPKRSWYGSFTWSLKIAAQAVFIALRLQTRVSDRSLRQVYRSMISEALRRRSPLLLHILAMKCAMHYHATRLTGGMIASTKPVNTF
jgi:hypothetical protein